MPAEKTPRRLFLPYLNLQAILLQPRQAASLNLIFPAKAPGQTLSAKTRENVPLMLT